MDLKELNEEVFQFLLQKRKADPNLRYNLRKNKGVKMEEGQWFHGSKTAIYISFWDVWGIDNKLPFPSIRFEINLDGKCGLYIDGRQKDITIWTGTRENVGLAISLSLTDNKKEIGDRFIKEYENNDFKYFLDYFINIERPFINSFLKLRRVENDYPPFGEAPFLEKLNKIESIRKGKQEFFFNDSLQNRLFIDCLQLTNINVFTSLNLSFDKQITCFVGENGTGKSTILRAIALGLVGASPFKKTEIELLAIKEAKKKPLYCQNGNITLFYTINKEEKTNEVNFTGLDSGRDFKVNGGDGILQEDNFLDVLVVGFAQQTKTDKHELNREYSPNVKDVRPLIINKSENRFDEFLDWIKTLINADTQIDRQSNRLLIKKIFSVIENITGDAIGLTSDTDVFVKTNYNESGIPAPLLSQGYQNILTWVGVFMKRLWEYSQTLPMIDGESIDFKDIPAVCLIDEIDTYLHPDWQYSILKGLVDSFPNVQFFITSHSPFVLTSVPSDKITIYELDYVKNTEGGEIIAGEISENLYGADANRSTGTISKERLPEVQNMLSDIDALIEVGKFTEAEQKLNTLKIDKSDISYILAKRKLQVERLALQH